MNNPWLEPRFVKGTYVLEEDYDCICQHNNSVGSRKTRFITDSIPEPFIGNKDSATVVLLGKNPGHSDDDRKSYFDPGFREAMLLNLQHKLKEYPFYPLNPLFAATGAGQWWRKSTRELREAGLDDATLAEKLMVIEWFPYHSERFARPRLTCESQKYSFWLAKSLLGKKLVVRMRARAEWSEVGAEFFGLRALKNPQCGHISKGNTQGDLFEQIVTALKR